jgi:hypothetical protein
MESTLFDANTAMPAHQDWWYLDSMGTCLPRRSPSKILRKTVAGST